MHSYRALPLLAVCHLAVAYDAERAANNFAHEAAECSAYFMVISTVPALEESAVKGLRAKFEALLAVSVALTSEKLTRARFELATKSMKRSLDGSWANLSIVNNEYGYRCIDLSKDPEARYRYWIEKKD